MKRVFIEVLVETLEEAEALHDAVRQFVDEFEVPNTKIVEDSGIQDL